MRTIRTLALVHVLALVLVLCLPWMPASAQPSFGAIDSARSGSLSIHKHAHRAGDEVHGDPATGEMPNPTAAIAGVEFQLYALPFNLLENAGWAQLEKYTPPADATGLEQVQSVTTGADGVATAKDLAVGAYLVVEASAPATVVDRSAPFMVTIPHPTSGETPGWLYDVHVFPKNAEFAAHKAIDHQDLHGLALSAPLHFPVRVRIPVLPEGRSFEYLAIFDTFDEHLNQLSLESVTLEGEALEEKDYALHAEGQQLRLALSSSGLEKLKAAGGKDLVATFSGVLTALGDGSVKNRAQVAMNTVEGPTPDTPPEPGTPIDTNEVTSNWGEVSVHKVDSGDGATALAGATFAVYPAKDPYPSEGCSPEYEAGEPVVTLVTDSSGNATAQLFVSDDYNETREEDGVTSVRKGASERCYVLVETDAPAGFITPRGEAAATAVRVSVGSTATTEYTISNVKRSTPRLPLSGGQGSSAILLAGGAVILLSAGLGVVYMRRR